VEGVARKMDRAALKSDYCTKKATAAFEELIKNISARYILLSYNNMAKKGDDRSNARIEDIDIMRILSAKGEVRVFTQQYKPFSAGRSDISGHEERLFLCICKSGQHKIIQSPLNYTGGKVRLLSQLLPHIPKRIDTFVDLFCGGCNVGMNVSADRVIFNDSNRQLINLYNTFRTLGRQRALNKIYSVIDSYGLSHSAEKGYSYYGCKSSEGLAGYNRQPFMRLREDFNNSSAADDDYYIMLYVLIVYAFNNQIRFNSSGKFNLPVGKRDFNANMLSKFSAFIDRLDLGRYDFTCRDFRELDMNTLSENSLVYCDPPYLITCAAYNEQGGWNEQSEQELLSLLDLLNERQICFALSNVLSSKGRTNMILREWLNQRSYQTTHLNYSYSNSSYQLKDKTWAADEVLITNYEQQTL